MSYTTAAQTNRFARQRGFSLIELLVATVLVGMLSVVLSQTLITTIRSNIKADLQKDIKENGDYALDYIGRIVRNGKKVIISPGIECKDGQGITSTDSLTITDPAEAATVISCDPMSKKIKINGTPITSSNVELLDSCILSCTSQASAPASVGVTFTLKQAGNISDIYQQASQTFSSTFTLRNK